MQAAPQQLGRAESLANIPTGLRLGGRFEVEEGRTLGSGSFWTVFAGKDVSTGTQVAIKLQDARLDPLPMKSECEFLERLREVERVPKILGWGTENGLNYIAMVRLGPHLQTLVEHCGGRLSARTVLRLGVELLEIVRAVHRCSVLHRDIKPENILFDRESRPHLVDLGFAKLYTVRGAPSSPAHHIPEVQGKRFVGTPLFAPLCVHEGRECGRKDDLESALYVLVYVYYGKLPWSDLPRTDPVADGQPIKNGKSPDWYPAIAAMKRKATGYDLVGGDWASSQSKTAADINLPPNLMTDTNGAKQRQPGRKSAKREPMPECFAVLFNYLCMLRFKEAPCYKYMIDVLRSEIAERDGSWTLDPSYRFRYDWLATG
jgi:serine/threonine protein kinase